MDIQTAVMVLAALALVFVLSKVNNAIKLLNNRLNIISSAQKEMQRRFREKFGGSMEDEFDAQERELRQRLERDFR